jgi:hypothetical protein
LKADSDGNEEWDRKLPLIQIWTEQKEDIVWHWQERRNTQKVLPLELSPPKSDWYWSKSTENSALFTPHGKHQWVTSNNYAEHLLWDSHVKQDEIPVTENSKTKMTNFKT